MSRAIIQIRWTDENRWTDYQPVDLVNNATAEAQVEKVKRAWAATKEKDHLDYDIDVRVR